MSIAPVLGWTLLSRDALKRASAQLNDDFQGVRDEVGFLALHQAYANRFFPGTSVLHTRLRYVLFVPWIYEHIRQTSKSPTPIERLVEAEEIRLAARLKKTDEKGIIGRNVLPRATAQPPSMVYWSALREWGLLKPNADGSFPRRADLNRAIQATRRGSRLADDEQVPLDEDYPFFIRLPNPPVRWNREDALSFHLMETERRFLAARLASVRRPEPEGGLALLARLAKANLSFGEISVPWDDLILELADPADRDALCRAKQAAAIAAIGRGIYAALVEATSADFDHCSVGEPYRVRLVDVIDQFEEDARALQIGMLGHDAPDLAKDPIRIVLKAIQEWLGADGKDIELLRATFTSAELARKKGRARLPLTPSGQSRRAEWQPSESFVEPLHYRWGRVQRLLQDLQGEP